MTENLVFNTLTPVDSANLSVYKWTFKGANALAAAVRYAYTNPEEVAKIEHECNNGQPVECTMKHLKRAIAFIRGSDQLDATILLESSSVELNALNTTSIGDFLLHCHVAALQSIENFSIYLDAHRKKLIIKLFGSQHTEEVVPASVVASTLTCIDQYECTQIIFESGDIESAIDAFLVNLSDQTVAPWRIRSVYVQESLKNDLLSVLSVDRLNNVQRKQDKAKNTNVTEQLLKRFGGKAIESSDGAISLLLDVPAKYVPKSHGPGEPSTLVCINFFRTPKEVVQLIEDNENSDCNVTQLSSVWTENVSLMYEMAANLKSTIIWGNSYGLFDATVPCLHSAYSAFLKSHQRFVAGIKITVSVKYKLLFYFLALFHCSIRNPSMRYIALTVAANGNT